MIPIAANQWKTRSEPGVLVAVATMLAAAILIQSNLIPVDADVSWLITVCERVLGGERLYVDIIEANPPASVWLYIPAVWFAQLLGWRPEAVVVAFAMAVALLSVQWMLVLSARLQRPPDVRNAPLRPTRPPPALSGASAVRQSFGRLPAAARRVALR